MSLTPWMVLFAVVMTGAIVVMLGILLGLVTDGTEWAGHDARTWRAMRRRMWPVKVGRHVRRLNS